MGATINNYTNLSLQEINGAITEIFTESMEERTSDKGNLFFDEVFDANQAYSYQMMPSSGGVQRTAEGQDYAKVESKQGHKKVTQQYKYADQFIITDEMRHFVQRHWEITKAPQNLVREAMDKIDQSKADMINNAFSTTYTDCYGYTQDNTTPDSVALASDSHTVVTSGQSFGNIIYLGKATGTGTPNPALVRESIVAGRAMGAKFEDNIGVKSKVDLDTLVVSTDDEDQADRIVRSTYLPGTPNNDINSSLGIKNVIAWERLNGTAFQLCDITNIGELFQMNTSRKPTLQEPKQFIENEDMTYKMSFFYGLVLKYAKFMFFSKGTNAV